MSSGNEDLSPGYTNKVLKFFNRLFQLVHDTCPTSGWSGVASIPAAPSVVAAAPPPPPVLLPPYVSSPLLPAPPTPLIPPLIQLCSSLTKLADLDDARLSAWLSTLILGRPLKAGEHEDAMASLSWSIAQSPEDEMFSSASSSLAFAEKPAETQVSDYESVILLLRRCLRDVVIEIHIVLV